MVQADDGDSARRTVFFGSLPARVFEAVARNARVQTLAAGQTLFEQGQRAEDVFAVLQGQIKLSMAQRDGSEVVVDTFTTGMSFAEAMVFDGSHYPVSAIALEDSRVFAAPAAVIHRELRQNPDAFDAILAATYRHLHRLVRQIEQLKSETGIQRLARYLHGLHAAGPAGQGIDLPVEKQVLASLLGIKPETLSRCFKRLQSHGVVVQGRRVQVTDLAALEAFVEKDC